jgi:hypothetical protein
MARRIPILIIIDCEPDPRHPRPQAPDHWIGFENLFAFLSGQRQRMAEATGRPARFGWFWRMDPQIEVVCGSAAWAVETYKDQIKQAEKHGDEMGLHVHGWRWDEPLHSWVADHGNAAWMEHCIRSSFSEFQQNFDRPCEIVRMGDGWFSDQATGILEHLGVRIDLTVEPDMPAAKSLAPEDVTTGLIPDRADVLHKPYHPSLGNFRVPDRDGATRLWMLPVTTGRAPRRRRGWARILPTRLAPPELELLQLNLSHSRRRFVPIFERAISRGDRPYAAICARSDGGYPRPLKSIERNIRYMLRHRHADRFMFVTPTEALGALQER